MANPSVRPVELSFLAFGAAEYGVWLAVLVYAYQRGGATLAGVIAVVQLLPAAIVAPLAAHAVDRRGAAVTLRLGYAVQAVTLSLTALAMLLGTPAAVVYLGAVATASALTLIRPAQSALMPSLVADPADLTAANAVTGWVESVSVLIGPSLAGAMIGLDGPGAALGLFASAIIGATVLLGAPGRPHSPLPASLIEAGQDGDIREIGQDTASGVLAALRADSSVTVLLALVAVQFVALGALDVLEVVLAVRVLGLGPSGAGYLDAAYGAGGVLGAVGTLALIGRRQLARISVLAASISGAAFLALGVWPTVGSGFALLAVVGASRAVLDVAIRTILHRAVLPAYRGRVFGVQEGLSMLGLALGSISVPVLVNTGGPEAALVGVGGLLLGVAVLVAPTLQGIERSVAVPIAEIAALKRSPLFGMLASPVLEELAHSLVRREIGAGEVIVREGELGDRFYLVAAGVLDVSIGERHVQALAPGDSFGEIALLRDGVRIATVTARDPGILYSLERLPFLDVLTGSRHVHQAMHKIASERLGAA